MAESKEERQGPGRPRDPDLAEQRTEEILRHAIGYFARNGFFGADVDAVAAAAGCAKGTVYRYFKSKRHLFSAAVDLVMSDLIAATLTTSAEDPLERLEHAIRSYLMYFDAHPESIELLVQERAEFRDREEPTFFQFRRSRNLTGKTLVGTLMDQGRFRSMPVDQALDIVGNLLYGTIFTNYFAGRTTSLEQQATDIVDVLMIGLMTPPEAEKWRTRTETRIHPTTENK